MEINSGLNRLIEDPNQVYHDTSLRGKGTKAFPLKVSVDGLNINVDSDELTGDGTAEHPITILPDCAILAEDGSPIITEDGEFLRNEICSSDTVDLGYTIFTGVASQSGTNAPGNEIIFQNTLGFIPTWEYAEPGIYAFTSEGNFANPPYLSISGGSGQSRILSFVQDSNDSVVVLATDADGVPTNDNIFYFEIKQYVI